jgi:hypothetical protein
MSFYQSLTGKPIDGLPENTFAAVFELIPNGTQAPAMIKTFELKEPAEFDAHYQIVWKIVDGEFKGREVRQSIKAFDSNPDKKDRALNMMVRLFKLCEYRPSHQNAPTNQDLIPCLNKVFGIKIQEWSIVKPDGSISEGNWVSEVHKSDAEFPTVTGVKIIKTPKSSGIESALTRNAVHREELSDDIPF